VETRRIDILFGMVVIAFLVVTLTLIKEVNYRRANDYKEYAATLSSIVKQKNNKIKVIAHRLFEEQKENEALKNALAGIRNDVDALNKKLTQQAPVIAPTSVSIPAVAIK